jgi:NAD(P)-dependent dehydrogenase (short-subunit alcohol dehydrogenase family)
VRDPRGRNAQAVRELDALARSAPGRLTVLEVDVADAGARARFIAAALEQVPQVDVLINNAGVMYSGVTEAFSIDQLHRQLEVNTVAPFHLAQLVLPAMRARRSGLVLHVSSIGGGLNFPFFSMYSGTKAALESIAEGMRHELAPFGIDSVVLEPGPFATRLIGSNSPPARADVAAEYGPVAALCRTMEEDNQRNLSGDNPAAQDPAVAAAAIARLVSMQAGTRPFRTIAGAIDFGLAPLNEMKDSVQQGVLAAWNLAEPLAFRR